MAHKSPSEYPIQVRTSLQTGPTEAVLESLAHPTQSQGSRMIRGPPVSIETNNMHFIPGILKPNPKPGCPGIQRIPIPKPENHKSCYPQDADPCIMVHALLSILLPTRKPHTIDIQLVTHKKVTCNTTIDIHLVTHKKVTMQYNPSCYPQEI